MTSHKIGFLHPGDMGISLAAAAQKSGHTAYWVSAGRSAQTRARADEHDLLDARTLADLCAACSYIVSICPPHAAEEVAQQVAAHSFQGFYIDANAIAPQRARRIGLSLEEAGADFVDGGIIGMPAIKPGTTWLYLSGTEAEKVAECFSNGPLETSVLGDEIG
ncbi:MAG: NAD(P)-dependent oxidoreductase, partial [Gemmatimonadetes bacterium]|nr:NAD(P)-dependent oxidoreductase [Gemmatimonadota bacterium]